MEKLAICFGFVDRRRLVLWVAIGIALFWSIVAFDYIERATFCIQGRNSWRHKEYLTASQLLSRATRKDFFGRADHSYARTSYWLAESYSCMNRDAEAEPYFRIALKVQTDLDGKSDPDTIRYYAGLWNCLAFQFKNDEAKSLWRSYHQGVLRYHASLKMAHKEESLDPSDVVEILLTALMDNTTS